VSYTTKTMLGTTVYGTPSGNYNGSSADFLGNVVQAANYYNGRGSMQTVIINVNNFVGTIDLKGSLNDPLNEALWFKTDTFGNAMTATSGIYPITVVGNFVWMVPEIKDFVSGTINSITISY
jgi:hypothetical protein